MVWTANVVYYTEASFIDPTNVLWMVAHERAPTFTIAVVEPSSSLWLLIAMPRAGGSEILSLRP
jgi:hypothetical protein